MRDERDAPAEAGATTPACPMGPERAQDYAAFAEAIRGAAAMAGLAARGTALAVIEAPGARIDRAAIEAAELRAADRIAPLGDGRAGLLLPETFGPEAAICALRVAEALAAQGPARVGVTEIRVSDTDPQAALERAARELRRELAPGARRPPPALLDDPRDRRGRYRGDG